MADGSTKPIEKVKPGDLILADDPEDIEKPKGYKVVAVPKNWTKRLIHFDVDQDNDKKSDAHYRATGKHPVWTVNRGWQYAVDLKLGDKLLTDDVTEVTVLDVSEENIVVDTYNLSVEGVHTFYVVDAGLAVLVHNTDFIVDPGGTAFPVPEGATGPTPSINKNGIQTGVGYTGGSGGANGQVDTLRNMNPNSKNPTGYVAYENPSGQKVDPYSGRTVPESKGHHAKTPTIPECP